MKYIYSLVALMVLVQGCKSSSNEKNAVSNNQSSTSSQISSTSDSVVTDTSIQEASTIEELKTIMAEIALNDQGIIEGSKYSKYYPGTQLYRELIVTQALEDQIEYVRIDYRNDNSLSINRSGDFFNGGLSFSIGTQGLVETSSQEGLITTREEAYNRIFNDYGRCSITNQSEVEFQGQTFVAYKLKCSNEYSISSETTIIPELGPWINPVQQVVYKRNKSGWVLDKNKTFYVYEYSL